MALTEAEHQIKVFDALVKKFPKHLNVKNTKYLRGLLKALSVGDAYISTQVESVRSNLIAVTAVGRFLDRAAGRYGIVRGQGTGILDPDFQKLIPVLGLSPKQISHILMKVIDVVYGPYASHANVTAATPEPYALAEGFDLKVRVDDTEMRIVFEADDAADITAATTDELATAISRKTKGRIVGSTVVEARTNRKFLNIRTATAGSQGFVQVLGGTAQSKIHFPEVREITPGISTWDVTRYLGSDEMIYTVTAGPIPNFSAAGVVRGDLCTIRVDSGFSAGNVGTFPVTFVGTNFFRVRNGGGAPESTVTQTHTDDFTFYAPDLSNVLLSARPAALVETSPRELTIILPVTSPIVKRTIRGGHHFHQGLTSIASTTATTATILSMSGFVENGAFRPCLSRKPSKGTVSSVGATTVTLISGEGWPTRGAFWAANVREFFYFSGRSADTLTGVSPAPPVNLAGALVKYVEQYRYGTITGSVLNSVYPNPSGLENQEISASGAITGTNFPGSYMYDRTATFAPAASFTTITETIRQGSVKTLLQVDDVTGFPEKGFFVLEFATGTQEGPIRYHAKVGTKALIVDPGHIYARDHLSGVGLRLVRQIGPYTPRLSGQDLAVYTTSTSPARDLLAQYLRLIAASGVKLRFEIRVPEQKWPILPNLYATDPLATELVTI